MFLFLNILDLNNGLIHQFPSDCLLLIEKLSIVEQSFIYEVSLIVSCDLRVFKCLQHDEHLILQINISCTKLEDQCKVELKVTVDHWKRTLVAFFLNHNRDFLKFRRIKHSIGKVYVLQVSPLVNEDTALEVTLEVWNMEFQLSWGECKWKFNCKRLELFKIRSIERP